MPPDQPPQQNQYDFIMNPQKPPSRFKLPGLGSSSSFARKLILIAVAAVVLFIAAWVVGLILRSGGTSTEALISLVQSQQEIVRVAEFGDEAVSQNIQSAAANTRLTILSHQQFWLSALSDLGTEPEKKQLDASLNSATDDALETASQNNNFDQTFTQIMCGHLAQYSSQLESSRSKLKSNQQTKIGAQIDQSKLLTEQLGCS